ncbi:DMT family transporter [Candidatus Nomurabacteria bacterium]|nr:DMT family transporter [Candidatus Nomurabacteria bacterium]
MDKNRQGEIFILAGAFFWGLFPVITILSLNNLPPLMSLAWSTLFASIFFAIIITIKKNWKELKNKSALKDMVWVTFITSILFYVLFFSGLSHTNAGNASIIALTEVFFSFLLFHIWYKNYISREHIAGACLMLLGAFIVLYPNFTEFKIGDILILSAAFVAPLGNFFQQRARTKVSSETVLFVRSALATPFLFAIAYIFHQSSSMMDLKQSLFLVLINGFIILGLSKIFWIEGIHRISVTKANALSSVNPLLTLIFAWILLNDIPTVWQLFALIPMSLGVILLGINKKSTPEEIQVV